MQKNLRPTKPLSVLQAVVIFTVAALFSAAALALPATRTASTKPQSKSAQPQSARKSATAAPKTRPAASAKKKSSKKPASKRRRRSRERFYTSSFADDVVAGDASAGEDPVVRAAAVEALENMNGAVVAIDPGTGRVLAMVNQKLALSSGAQPCSTIKLAVALAALNEGIITKETQVTLGHQWRMNLTSAMAHSTNSYFEILGRQLGFEKVSYYAHQFGLGELAGENIDGEQLGLFPSKELDARHGGVGKMCSFGESISMTPLQLGALVCAIANGGTLYWLQHPRTPEEAADFAPRVKRQLDIARLIPQVTEGMAAAVRYGTARNVRYLFSEEEVLGKTGTCSKDGTRYGWFVSYTNGEHGRVVTVVFLRGGRPTYGPKAAEIAARMYRNLYDRSFFNAANRPPAPENRTQINADEHR